MLPNRNRKTDEERNICWWITRWFFQLLLIASFVAILISLYKGNMNYVWGFFTSTVIIYLLYIIVLMFTSNIGDWLDYRKRDMDIRSYIEEMKASPMDVSINAVCSHEGGTSNSRRTIITR
jgi:hypothetical protein